MCVCVCVCVCVLCLCVCERERDRQRQRQRESELLYISSKILIIGHYTKMFYPVRVIGVMFLGNVDRYHFIPLSMDLTFGLEPQGQQKAKPSGFIFSQLSTDESEI